MRSAFCAVLLLLAAGIILKTGIDASAHQANDIDGYWQGSVVTENGRQWNVALSLASGAEGLVAIVDFPDAEGYGRRFSAKFVPPLLHLERPQPTGPPIIFDGKLHSTSISGDWHGYGHDAPFTLQKTGKAPPQHRAEDVRFENGVVKLAGTLILPSRSGIYPAIVSVHGSGAAARTQYESKAIYFARRGIATLIYDKRGVGQSTGDWTSASMTDLASDALAGVRLLKSRQDINPSQIALEGFSQGGWVAPLAASLSRNVAFVIVGSPAGINPMEQSVFSMDNTLREAGFPDSAIAAASNLRNKLYDIIKQSASVDEVAGEIEKAHNEPWFKLSGLPYPLSTTGASEGEKQLLMFEPIPVWERIQVPVLAYWGSRDLVVPVERSKTIIERALQKAGNNDSSFRIFTGADHVMVLARDKTAEWDFPRKPREFDLIADWLLTHVGSNPARKAADRVKKTAARPSEDRSDNSYALEIVRMGQAALGKDLPDTVVMTAHGHELWDGQGANPNNPVLDSRLELEWKVDFRNKNLFYRRQSFIGSDLMWCFQQAVNPRAQYTELCHSGALHDDSAFPLAAGWKAAVRDFPGPNDLLIQAMTQVDSLRLEGQSLYGGHAQSVLSYTSAGFGKTKLYFDANTYLLIKVEFQPSNAPFRPDFIPHMVFSEYREKSGRKFPSKIVSTRQLYGLEVVTDVLEIQDIEFNRPLSVADYAPTKDAVPWQTPPKLTVKKVAENVYFVEDAAPDYNCMFFVADDFIVVVEAPISDAVSEAVIKAIHETVPDKRIRYLVPTHFHYDHSGGVARYLQEDLTVLTTVDNKSFFERIGKTGVGSGDAQAKKAKIETFDKETEFKNGSQIFKLYAVTNPHVDELVIAYCPNYQVLYVADPFTNDWGRLRRASPEEREMMKTLEALQLKPKIILSGHGPITSFDRVRSLL
jgi:pimeloyl-ACP methyl ester carboxylesterase/glyoxylase-like metal-dependent hydrolase (beta-lactamase superfamily II)